MSDHDDDAAINFWFRELFPEITEAWVLTAPEKPDEESYVVVPIPAGMFYDEIPTKGVQKALESQFFIKQARFVENLSERRDIEYAGPGLDVLCISWAKTQRRFGVFAE